jgi:hypothetical protein
MAGLFLLLAFSLPGVASAQVPAEPSISIGPNHRATGADT